MDENKVEAVEEKTVTPEAAAAPETADQAPRGNRRDNRNRGPRRNNPRFAREQKEYEERVVKISRVSKTVKGGRKMRFSALVVIGDRKGRVGYGLGKANEVPDAIRKALDDARKNVVRVPLVNGNRTIPHTVIGTYGAGEVILRPAAEGTGVVAGGTVRAVMELAGVTDVLGKCLGSRTPINAVRATMEAIKQLKTVNSVAKLREKKVEEIR